MLIIGLYVGFKNMSTDYAKQENDMLQIASVSDKIHMAMHSISKAMESSELRSWVTSHTDSPRRN